MPTVQKGHNCDRHYECKNFPKEFKCDGCKMKGFGKRYQCSSCGNQLHKECRSPKTKVQHEQFGGSTFTFLKNRTEYHRVCDACGKDIRGFSYHCEKKGLDLHPCCYSLKKTHPIGDTVFHLKANVSSKCMWCKKRKISNGQGHAPGLSYVSARPESHLHVYCMMEIVHEACKRYGENGLEKVDLRELDRSDRNRGSGSDHTALKIINPFLQILSAVLGDPTTMVGSALVELVFWAFQ